MAENPAGEGARFVDGEPRAMHAAVDGIVLGTGSVFASASKRSKAEEVYFLGLLDATIYDLYILDGSFK